MTQNTHVVLTPITYNVVPSDDIALVGPLVVPRHLAAIERYEEQHGHGYCQFRLKRRFSTKSATGFCRDHQYFSVYRLLRRADSQHAIWSLICR